VKIEIIPIAQQEIAKAAEYYRNQRSGLDAEFLEEIDAAVAWIARNPLMFEQVRPGIRRCLVERFLYALYYRTPDPNTVRIIVVKHHARRPGLGMRRK
jgi:plasmid stabilization system protein ParE